MKRTRIWKGLMIFVLVLGGYGSKAWVYPERRLIALMAIQNLSPEYRSDLLLAALVDEVFTLHFLEDVYAAGHIAGTWGVASVRKGTHDYYNELGLEVVTWDNKRMVLRGDAYMRPQDAEIAAFYVQLSIEQFLDAARGFIVFEYNRDSIALVNHPDSFSVCKNNLTPSMEKEIPSLKVDITI